MAELLGNLLDIFGITHKKSKKEVSAYMKRYYKAIDDYRKAYSEVIASKLRTPTEIKKLGLYDAEAFDQGVSAMGGKGMPILGIPDMGEIPILVPTNTTTYVPSLARIEEIEAKILQLQNIINGTSLDRKEFLREQRIRIKELTKEKLALQLVIALGEDPYKAKQYMLLTIQELSTRLISARNRPPADEIKEMLQPLSQGFVEDSLDQERNQSSEALSDVQETMRQSERSQPDSPYYQAIKKKGTNPTASSAVQWSALTELIRSSITYPQPHMGSLLMFSGTITSTRTKALQTALSRIGRIQGAPQQMLDLLSSFDIELRPPYAGMGADASRRYVSQQTQQFRDMDPTKKRQLLLNFNKLFRNLLKKVLDDKSLSIDDRKAIKRLHTDLLKGQNTESLKAPENSPEKPIIASDLLMTSNQNLFDTFLRLMSEVGYTDAEINNVNNRLSTRGLDQSIIEYDKLKKEDPEMPESEARMESRAKAYVKMIQQFLTYIQSLENKMRLTEGLDEVKLKTIIEELYIEARRSYDEAIKNLARSSVYPDIATTFNSIFNLISSMRSVYSSLITPTTLGGLPLRTPRSTPPIDEMKYDATGRPIPPPNQSLERIDPNGPSSQAIVNEVVNNPNPQLEAKTSEILRAIGQPATSVSINIRGNDIGIGIPVVVINWSQMPLNMLRMFLRDRLSQDMVSSSELLRRRLDIVKNGTFEEVSRLADDLITDRRERLGIIKRFDLTPAIEDWETPIWINDPNAPEDPEDPPEPPSGSFIISINGRHRIFDVRIIISLLIALGVAITSIVKIVEKIRNGKDANVRGTVPPTETKDPTNIGTGDSPNNNIPSDNVPPNIPTSNLPMFPTRGGNTDPIYGGIGNIAPRSQPFKPIGYPTLDEKLGADYIQADENMLKNSAIMELVQSYNDDATRYNELIALKYDLEKSEQSLTPDELKELTDLSTGMKNQIAIINQQAPLVPFLQQNIAGDRYYAPADSIKPTKTTGAFVSSSGESISNVYPLIPMDNYTKSIGLNDDIQSYNALAKEYNALALKYKGARMDPYWVDIIKQKSEEPEYAKALARATAIDTQIQPIISKINSVMANPESSVGREYGRTLGYNDLQKSLIDKVANITDWNLISSITEQEKQSLRDNPELYKDFESFLTTFNMKTNNGKDALSLDRDNPKWSEFYRVKQRFIDLKKANYKMSNEKAPLTQTDWKLVQQDSQKEYVRSKQDFLDAVARLKNAKASGLSSHQVSQLYNDLETKRLHYETSRQTYEKMADSYKHALSGRTSFLADMTNERLPSSPAQVEKFDRLQTIERILQNNPDALKEYNDTIVGLGIKSRTSIEQNYDLRTKLIEGLATKYNLVNEYTDASTREIDVKVPNLAEDPSTIVDFQGEGSDEVGESTERANFIDPAEATLFISSDKIRQLEQKRWEDFSLVQPWNGLGNPQTNPLLRHQVQEYITRYGKCDKAPKPTPQQMRQLCCYRDQIIKNREFQPNYKTDFPFMPTVQASFGREIWENEFAVPTNNFQSQQAVFTREDSDLPNNQFSTWYPKTGSIYHPDRQIDMNDRSLNGQSDPSSTAKLRTNSSRRPVFEGLPSGLNQQYGSQQVSQFGGETMNNNFGSIPLPTHPQRKPTSVFDNLDPSARRTMSMRR